MTGAAARPALTVFTPLPPQRNGIADYAALLIGALQDGGHYACAAACEAWDLAAPPHPDVPVLDAALAHRRIAPGGRVLHQLGNNPQHGFVLRALRRHPGVTTLHDPGLLHLHETAGEGGAAILAGMADAPPALAAAFARHLREHGVSTRADHVLFDLAGEVLARSRAVVVHSRFARERLRALHGPARAAHVAVVPHPLPRIAMPPRGAARARLGVGAGDALVVTAGFATRSKRFDWLIRALEAALAAGAALRWIHAGEERPEEFALAAAIAAAGPALRGRARVAGWLPDDALGAHLAAADVVVNLRFPSPGESSGTLARALAAGACCVVSDTAAYAELPRHAVVHIPVAGAVPALAAALGALARDPGLARAIGAAGRAYALREMDPAAVAAAYAAVVEDSLARPVVADPPPADVPPFRVVEAGPGLQPASVAAALAGAAGRCRLLLRAPSLDALATLTLRGGPVSRLLPPGAALLDARVLAGTRAAEAPGLLLTLDLPCRP